MDVNLDAAVDLDAGGGARNENVVGPVGPAERVREPRVGIFLGLVLAVARRRVGERRAEDRGGSERAKAMSDHGGALGVRSKTRELP